MAEPNCVALVSSPPARPCSDAATPSVAAIVSGQDRVRHRRGAGRGYYGVVGAWRARCTRAFSRFPQCSIAHQRRRPGREVSTKSR